MRTIRNVRTGISHSYRDLLFAWTSRIIRARYQQSILGGLWAVIQPAASVIVFSVIFTYFIPIDTGNIPYPVFSYTAMAPWVFFSTSMMDMVESLVANMNLVTKIYFPRDVFVLSALLARGFDFIIAYGILFLLLLFFSVPFVSLGLLYLPLILAVQLAFSLGLGLIGSALNVFYRDIKHVFALGLQLWFYATPIIYPVALVPEKWRTLYFLNPMAGIIEAYRSVILYQENPGTPFYLASLVSLVVLAVGYWLFKRVEHLFADIV